MSDKQKGIIGGSASDDPFWKYRSRRIKFVPLNKEKDFGMRIAPEKIAYGVNNVCGCVVGRILLLKTEARKQKNRLIKRLFKGYWSE